ncbi:MAG: DUF1496 domain-containing protein [Afipia sp.]|nr:DUF1496 domain-containing protein [Afipia sp.]
MRRQILFVFSSVIALPLLVAPVSAQAPQQSASTPLCVYDSKNYSDGAYICAQKSMMLTCQTDGAKASWKIVTDKDINDRCIAPIVRANITEPRIRRRHYIRPVAIRPADPNAKYFNFNGKRYCE